MKDSPGLWNARVILEDGTIWKATSFGASGEAGGEVVFNTALSGYQEVLTDPSYHGQVVVMTYPLIGNYGVNVEDEEAPAPCVAGFLVREASRIRSNYRSTEGLQEYLCRHGIVGLEGMDTRALTRRIREAGAMRIFMTTEPLDDETLKAKLAEVPDLVGRDMVQDVTVQESFNWSEGLDDTFAPKQVNGSVEGDPPKVVAFHFGAKSTIFRSLRQVGFDVVVVPSVTTAEEVLAMNPDGVFLSNGPGDPRPLEYCAKTVGELLGKVPLFGICLGHQILAQAVGAEIVKLKFGHHGSNHPVMDLRTGKVEITAQNHGFAVTRESLEQIGARVSHVNLNDGTVEGMELPDKSAFSVQYHPEASPGPHDSSYLFQRFMALVQKGSFEAV